MGGNTVSTSARMKELYKEIQHSLFDMIPETQFLCRQSEQITDFIRKRTEIPDVSHRHNQLDMSCLLYTSVKDYLGAEVIAKGSKFSASDFDSLDFTSIQLSNWTSDDHINRCV